jgi:hypothetical protein
VTLQTPSDHRIDRRIWRRVMMICLCSFPAVAAINASSQWTDAVRQGSTIDPALPWIYEFTSVGAMMLLVPLLILLERRFPLVPGSIAPSLLALAAGSVAFSLLHVAGMVLLRMVLVPAIVGPAYTFFEDPLTDLVYEYRKDLFPYAAIIGMISLSRSIEESREEAEAARTVAHDTGRLTLKSGGRTIFLDAASLEWAKAAGNYVELSAAGRTHLPRITLTALEEQLRAAGIDVVRVHRSHVVNRAMIAEVTPAGDGDYRVRLRDGQELRGSRRYRGELGV